VAGESPGGKKAGSVRTIGDLDVGAILPTLQRFYGGSWSEWLDLPEPVFAAYVEMLSVLKAQESLQRAAEVRLGGGPKSKRDEPWHKSTQRRWERVANTLADKSSGKSGASYRMNMAAAGIPVIRVPRKKKEQADGG